MKGRIACPHCQTKFDPDDDEIMRKENLQESAELGTKPEEPYYIVQCPACKKWIKIKRKK